MLLYLDFKANGSNRFHFLPAKFIAKSISCPRRTLVKFTYPGQRPKIRFLSYYGSWLCVLSRENVLYVCPCFIMEEDLKWIAHHTHSGEKQKMLLSWSVIVLRPFPIALSTF